jgi:transcriptional regulator with XRE-family HTH domain
MKHEKGYCMAKKFRTLRERMFPEARAESHALVQKYEAEMALDELREARKMTQVGLANILGINQAAVSKMEHRADMYISTLRTVIKAMGGELRIQARFPEGNVEIAQFRERPVLSVQNQILHGDSKSSKSNGLAQKRRTRTRASRTKEARLP